DDRVLLGQQMPTWQGGLGNNISFKGFDLSVFLVARLGSMVNSDIHAGQSSQLTGRYNDHVADYWTPNNPTNSVPQPRADLEHPVYGDTRRYHNGDFIRVRNIGLSYNVPTAIVRNVIGAQSVKFTVNAENPYIISPYVQKYNGVDPETSTGLSTPSMWTLQFGLSLSL
ncbi:MAG: hypothetical protein WD491_09870, partial [Balneolales bacterium]